ncbi:unnamed protein product [Lactuca saligna]|uniref:Transmembrane protein n=1 Tax=Lactuca saligna TaxID=75948 RepID=A0AA35Z349_LACSI|nr:unnamed protein product [Lactuca saligna]
MIVFVKPYVLGGEGGRRRIYTPTTTQNPSRRRLSSSIPHWRSSSFFLLWQTNQSFFLLLLTLFRSSLTHQRNVVKWWGRFVGGWSVTIKEMRDEMRQQLSEFREKIRNLKRKVTMMGVAGVAVMSLIGFRVCVECSGWGFWWV